MELFNGGNMCSYFNLGSILLGTTVLTAISTPTFAVSTNLMEAVGEANADPSKTITYSLTADQGLIDTQHPTGSTLGFIVSDGKDIPVSSKLTINGQSAAPKIYGSMGIFNGSTLTINDVGGIASGATIDPDTYDIALAGYWTSGSNSSATSSTIPALINSGSKLDIDDSVFANSYNTSTSTSGVNGGAIKLDSGSTTSIDNSLFYKNQTDNFGGAIDIDDPTAVVTKLNNSYFIKNNAADHGGAVDLHGTIQQMNNTQFAANAAPQGGALYVHNGGTLTATQDAFIDNQAAQGGAIYADTNANMNISNTTFMDNITHNAGVETIPVGAGAVYNDGTFTSSQNTYTGNEAQNNGQGGAVFNDRNATFVSTNDTFTENKAAQNGGAVSNTGTATIQNATFTENTTAGNGGAIANSSTGEATISGSTSFTGNKAIGNGGAVYNAGELSLEGSNITFTGNKANVGSAVYNEGTLNIKNANDTIDLDYMPYTEALAPANSHLMFAENEDIYNNGIMNIENSNLQLHGGINTKLKNKTGTVNLNGSRVDVGTNVIYGDTININSGSQLMTHIDMNANKFGHVEAKDITVSDTNTTLTAIVEPGSGLAEGESKKYEILDAANGVTTDFSKITENKLYKIEKLGDGEYLFTREKTPSSDCEDGDCDANETNTAHGWLDGDSMVGTGNDVAIDIQRRLNELAQTVGCESKEYREALDGLAPDVSPLIQAHATEITRRLASVISNRLYSSMERTGYVHRGKRFYKFPRHNSNLWVQGLYGQSEFDTRKGFDMDTRGIALGFDGHVSEALRMGLGYAYTKADGTSVQRDTDINSHSIVFYGEYNPNRFYANWLANYTRSEYDEEKKVFKHHLKANYDVDAFGTQVMFGEKLGPVVIGDWASGVLSPEIGARYIYTKQHGYTDTAGQHVGSADGQTLTGILGAQYTIGYTLSPTLAWYPELRAALTYDFVEPDTKTRVNLLNGSTYQVTTDKMDRFGIEVGARIGLDINRTAEVSVEYEGLFKGDYTNHTGLANLKYKF